MTFTQGFGVALILVCLLWFIWVCLTSGRTPIQYFRFEGEDEDGLDDGGCYIEERTQ